MHIAELFYPAELKQIITELRIKGDLNHKALLDTNRSVHFPLIIWALFIFVALYQQNWFVMPIILVLGVFVCRYAVRYSVYRLVLPYTRGMKANAKVDYVFYGRKSTSSLKGLEFTFNYEHERQLKRKKFDSAAPVEYYTPIPKVGDVIPIYLDAATGIAAPFYPKLFELLCLSQSRVANLVRGS